MTNVLHLVVVVVGTMVILAAVARPPDPVKPPAFVAATADGKTAAGPLRELKADWSLRLGDEIQIASGDWLSLRRDKAKLPALPTEQHLLLFNGDRIPCDGVRLDGESLVFKHPDLADGKESRVPLSALSVVFFTTPDNTDPPDAYRRTLAKATRTRDQVILRNGDVLEGVVNALNAKTVEVEVDKKPVTVALDKVAAVALATDVRNTLKPKGVYARVVLAGNGTRLSLASATCTDGRTLEGKTVFGGILRVPLERVAALDVYQGRAVYLSDLKPSKFEFTPYLGDGGIVWPLVADGSVANRDLRLAGSTYDKGIGLHTRSVVTYSLAGAYRRFEALVGLDDETDRDARARVRVLADGKALDLGPDRELTGRTDPMAIGVSVVGIKELTLEVDFGARGDVQGRVDWCDARLVK